MKRYVLLHGPARFCAFALLLICIGYACRSRKAEEIAPVLPANEYVLTPGQRITLQTGFTIIPDTVNIFICPPEAACFAPDNVFASLRVTTDQESRRVRLFALMGDNRVKVPYTFDSTGVVHRNRTYSLVLRGQYTNSNAGRPGGRAILRVTSL